MGQIKRENKVLEGEKIQTIFSILAPKKLLTVFETPLYQGFQPIFSLYIIYIY